MGGETDSVGVGFFEEVAVVRHGLSSVEDNEALVLMDGFHEVFEIFEATAVEVGSGVYYDEGVVKITTIERKRAIVCTSENEARKVMFPGERNSAEEGRVMLDVAGDDFFEVGPFGVELREEEVEAVGGV